MPKPSSLPEWASDANYPAGAEPEAGTPTKVEPVSGKKAIGSRPEEKPKAQNFNWLFNVIYQWCAYIDAGIWDGDLTVDGSLTVTGDAVIDGEISAGGGTNAFAGNIYAGGIVEAGDVLRFGGTEKLGISTGLATSTGHTISRTQIIFAASADTVYAPIIGLPVNACIVGMKCWFKKGTSNVTEINFDVVRNINNGADDYVGVNVSNAEDGIGDTSQEETGFEHFIAAGYEYSLRIDRSDTSISPAADRFYHAEIYWTKPPP